MNSDLTEPEMASLDTVAALAIRQLAIKEITRNELNRRVESLPVVHQKYFRSRLNHHKNAGLAKHKREAI